MAKIHCFDSCCYLGRHAHMSLDDGPAPKQPETVDGILAAMDHYGIHEALVIDPMSAAVSPKSGNQQILERTLHEPRLHPAWAGLMASSHELPPPAEFVGQMRDFGVGALFLFYGQFDISLSSWGIDDLLSELETARVPLFLCPTEMQSPGRVNATDWDNVVRLCKSFPNLPVVVTEHRIYNSQRKAWQAMAACDNLILDLSAIWLHKRVEYICREFGAHRLIWGSQLPHRCPGVPIMQLTYSDISEDQIARIAGGNMRELLSWNQNISFTDNVTFPPAIDTLHDKVRTRASFRDEQFHDCHGHIGWSSMNHVVEDGPEEIVAEMDKFGIRSCMVFSLEGILGDERWGNSEVARVAGMYPDRFVGFTLVNPNHGENAMLAELERGLELDMQGIKLIPHYQGYPATGPLVDVACQFAHDNGLLILNHDWGPATQIERLCTRYNNACFITGHSNGTYGAVATHVDNLYICSCPFLNWGQVEKYVTLYGADRILFGSDLTDLPIAWGLAPILYARISENEKRLILGENLLRIMDKWGIHPSAWNRH